eukprot:CAMPEP_0195078622 /NCGR_PEP_ID=MMETSP0448-20130528/20766_1 /TAXON_ID=66468 /ORGANISM="Heterocapsa triquestra, Strain CCMP 448" /LENGTH=108 /DNA_ID=CAMNT_0040111377 /DNA_START=55 /DNA_END=381 /DNA_ORIENTATION=-
MAITSSIGALQHIDEVERTQQDFQIASVSPCGAHIYGDRWLCDADKGGVGGWVGQVRALKIPILCKVAQDGMEVGPLRLGARGDVEVLPILVDRAHAVIIVVIEDSPC